MDLKPTRPADERLPALDVLRGLAILGTLATNIGGFVFVNRDIAIGPTLDRALQLVIAMLTNGYWLGLLTIMFGIGLAIQRESAVRRGGPWLTSYPWRAVLLVVEGFLNYLFIFQYDVLMAYGLTALVVCVVLVTPRAVQNVVLALGLVAHLAHLVYLTVRSSEGEVLTSGVVEQGPVTEAVTFAEPGYLDVVRDNLALFWHGGRAEIPIMFLMGIGLFLIGARLWEAGIFLPHGGRVRRNVMVLGLGIGLPLDWSLRIGAHFGWVPSDAVSRFVRYGTASIVAFGVLALVAHAFAGRPRTGRLTALLAPVGKTALSCYVLQNVIIVVLFADHAMNLDASMPVSLGVLDQVIAFVVVSAVLIPFARLWLLRFERGPLETVSHATHRWLVDNTTGRLLAHRR